MADRLDFQQLSFGLRRRFKLASCSFIRSSTFPNPLGSEEDSLASGSSLFADSAESDST